MRTTTPNRPPESKPVGIWIRVSTEDQARGESPEHHEHRARAYAEAKGWKIREVYHLEAVSGKSVMGLPETRRMLEHIASQHITGLIFSKLARLARNTRELLDFADIFREHEADLISLEEAIDTSSAAGRLFYTMIAAMAQWEREEIASRVAASVPIRAKLGKRISGAAPFGYQWKDKKLQPDPKESPVRRLMYELFLEHKRLKTVARLLNERGHRTRNSSAFSDTTLRRLIEDPTAKGVRRANYTRSSGDGKHWTLKPTTDWIHVPVEGIVSEELWEQCNALLAERRQVAKPPPRRTVQLFAGLTFCACGKKMYVPSNMPKYYCRGCHNKIGVEDLEVVFHEQLRGFLLSSEEVARHFDQADSEIVRREEAVETLVGERDRVAKEMDQIYRAYVGDQISVDGFGRTYRPLEERLKQVEDQLPRLQGELDFLKIENRSRDEILSEARDLHGRWPTLTPDEKRQIVENITEQVVIGKGDVTIHLCYLPSASELVATGQREPKGSWRSQT